MQHLKLVNTLLGWLVEGSPQYTQRSPEAQQQLCEP